MQKYTIQQNHLHQHTDTHQKDNHHSETQDKTTIHGKHNPPTKYNENELQKDISHHTHTKSDDHQLNKDTNIQSNIQGKTSYSSYTH